MKPVGSITNYFPFLEEETKNAMKTVMDKASNFYDFTVRLGNKVCDEEVSQELAYMAALHVHNAKEWSLHDRLREKYKNRPDIVVWTFLLDSISDKTLYRDEVLRVLSRVVEADPPDWMLIDLYRYLDSFFRITPSEIHELLRKVESILDRNQNFVCFEAYPHHLKSELHELGGDSVNAILARQRALEISREVDDVFWIMVHTGRLAYFLRNHNVTDALEYVEEYNKLSILLGLPRYMSLARNYLGLIYRVRGEYDMALKCQFSAIEAHDTKPSTTLSAAISVIYSDIEDGNQALRWANKSFRIAGGKGDFLMHRAMSLALIVLGRFEDADHHLNILHKLSLESAYENDQATYLHIRGFHELKSGNPQAAINILEQALLIFEFLNIQAGINQILIALTQAEIQLASEFGADDSSGPWMVRLESHARKRDYPGIQMHAALFRAEFYVKRDRMKEAQEVLQDALNILDSPSVKSLRKKIKDFIEELYVV